MDGDNTISFFFGSSKGRPSLLPVTNLRFDTDVSVLEDNRSILEDSSLNVDRSVNEDAFERSFMSARSERSVARSPVVTESVPPLEANDHARFADVLRNFQNSPEDNLSSAIATYLASVQAHLVVLGTLRRLEKDIVMVEFFKQERDTWILLDLLRTAREEKIASPISSHHLTDRARISFELSNSPVAQLLHTLIRWRHLVAADEAPSEEFLLSDGMQDRLAELIDVFEDERISETLLKLVQAGAFYWPSYTEESSVMQNRLERAFGSHSHLLWRIVSMRGGQPFEISGPHDRQGNAHRFSWKLACFALCQDAHSFRTESMVYSLLCGLGVDTSTANIDGLWAELRRIMEHWMDFILFKHHVECGQMIKGRSIGEADVKSEREWISKNVFYHLTASKDKSSSFSFPTNEKLESELRRKIERIFSDKAESAQVVEPGPLPKRTKTTKDETPSTEQTILSVRQFFRRIHHDIVTRADWKQIIDRELPVIERDLNRSRVREENEGRQQLMLSKLRFLCQLSWFSSIKLASEPEPILKLPPPVDSTLDQVITKYMEFLTSHRMCENVPPYLSLLSDSTSSDSVRIKLIERCFRGTAITWSDNQKTSFLLDVLPRITLIESTQTQFDDMVVKLVMPPFPDDVEDEHLRESTESRERRTKQMPVSQLAETPMWRAYSKRVELLRWSLLMNRPDLLVIQANEMLLRSVKAYLMESDVTTRTLAWKKGEWVIQCMRQSSSLPPNISAYELQQFVCWEAAFEAWRCLAVLDSQMDHIKSLLEWYNQQLELIGDRDPIAKRELLQTREEMIEVWTCEELSSDVPPNENLCSLATTLREAFQSAVECEFPLAKTRSPTATEEEQSTMRLKCRDKYIGKLILETFRSLDRCAKDAVVMRKLVHKAGLTKIHQSVIQLSRVVENELVRRLSRNSEIDEFRKEVQLVLGVVANASKYLMAFTNTPLALSFSAEDAGSTTSKA